ncbi:hypothetical protein RQP46_000433 [Phenoliferia psychrophenolica]
MEATSRSSTDTVFSADAIEFSPDPLIFACGTYQIEKDETNATPAAEDGDGDAAEPTVSRFGRCLLYEVDQDGSNLREVQRFDGPAILDMKWSTERWNDHVTLAIADAKGHVQLHAWDDTEKRLKSTQTITCADEKTLCLSLDWSDRRGATGAEKLVVSISDGTVCTLGGESELSVTSSWAAHDFEPWIAAFDCWNPSTVWTGCEQPTFVNKRTYDESIRIFDRRKPLSPLLTHAAGGGLWRLKWHPTRPERLLAAAMHGGFCVVDFEGLSSEGITGSGKTSTVFNGHDSLAYGVDWSKGAGAVQGGRDLVASCSFYDHLVHVWDVENA